jgi:hypothetical protein
MRQDMAERVPEMGRSGAHRRWRNRPDELADAASPMSDCVRLAVSHAGGEREMEEVCEGVL